MSHLSAATLAAHFAAKHGVVGARSTRRTLPVLTADVPVGRPGWTLAETCACCQRASVFAGTLCLRCFEIAEAKQMAKTTAEMAHQLVRK